MALPTPSPTLYVSNLETKTKKPELRQQLYALFNPYGQVIDIVAKKHDGGRGQAFIIFAEQAAATAAMRNLTGERFYERDLRISYAKSPSNAYIARTNPEASREAAAVAAAKTIISRAQGEYEQLEKEREAEEAGRAGDKRAAEDGVGGGGKRQKVEEEEEMEIEMEDDEDALPKESSRLTLICTNLPPECNEQIMSALFSQYTGFSRVTPLPPSFTPPTSHPSPNANAKAFRVTFDTREHAEATLGSTKGFLMQPGWEMGVSVE